MFVSVPPKLALSDPVRKMKRRSAYKIQHEFLPIQKRSWGRRFLGRGIFQPLTVPLHRTPYFHTSKSTSLILPVSAGSRSVPFFAEKVT